ncbi:unnamed protein product [Symbiodinium natans]|uniref:Uncharacterized protein n=1 Tax=Symbiodinium natans TaxID=878477 RepID=A0A812RSB6_9DINO|nr:unnamed protein product [Symbiodinium natans]
MLGRTVASHSICFSDWAQPFAVCSCTYARLQRSEAQPIRIPPTRLAALCYHVVLDPELLRCTGTGTVHQLRGPTCPPVDQVANDSQRIRFELRFTNLNLLAQQLRHSLVKGHSSREDLFLIIEAL